VYRGNISEWLNVLERKFISFPCGGSPPLRGGGALRAPAAKGGGAKGGGAKGAKGGGAKGAKVGRAKGAKGVCEKGAKGGRDEGGLGDHIGARPVDGAKKGAKGAKGVCEKGAKGGRHHAHVRGPDGGYCGAEGRGQRSTLLELVNGNKSLDVIVQDYPG
jgi:hypothetical protein